MLPSSGPSCWGRLGDSRVQQRFGYPVFFWPHCDRNSKKGPFFLTTLRMSSVAGVYG